MFSSMFAVRVMLLRACVFWFCKIRPLR